MVRPAASGKRSRKVKTSVSPWQGWRSSVNALTTGTEPKAARSSTSCWAKVRMTMPST